MTTTYFTKEQAFKAFAEMLRLKNAGNPEANYVPGLTEADTEYLGFFDSALRQIESTPMRVYTQSKYDTDLLFV